MTFLAYLAGLVLGALGGLYVVGLLLPASREEPATTGGPTFTVTTPTYTAGWRTWTT